MIELMVNNDTFKAVDGETALRLMRSRYGEGEFVVLPDLQQWDDLVMQTRVRVALDPFTHRPPAPAYQAQHKRYGFCQQCRPEMWRGKRICAPGDQKVYFLRPIDSIEHQRAEPARRYRARQVACATPFTDRYDRRWDRNYDDPGLNYQCGHAPAAHDEKGCHETAWLDGEYRVECPCEGYTRPAWLARVPA